MHKIRKILLLAAVLILCNVVLAQKPDSSYYYKVVNEFFNQEKPQKNQYKEFEDVYEIIYTDTAGLDPLPKEVVKSIEKEDEEFAKSVEPLIRQGGHVSRVPRETEIRFMDHLGRNLSINKYQRELTEKAHEYFGEPLKVTMQYYIHWSGKIAGVKLIRFSNEESIIKEKIVEFLTEIDYSKYKVIPEMHAGLAVNSVNIILIGF